MTYIHTHKYIRVCICIYHTHNSHQAVPTLRDVRTYTHMYVCIYHTLNSHQAVPTWRDVCTCINTHTCIYIHNARTHTHTHTHTHHISYTQLKLTSGRAHVEGCMDTHTQMCICIYHTQNTNTHQAVPTWRETTRDFKVFSKRESTLPTQEASDPIDIRNVLNRDGSVISSVSLETLANFDVMYRDLGCKVRQ